ncbi:MULTISPECIES: hypothetical protein [Cupriavidus]|uniref:hypothetical protein n=1 Tax=Cupriavidus TaxID=106589 RepID=UPI000367C379|nr:MULTISPECIES: hypothetical protein [Cupriavidus]
MSTHARTGNASIRNLKHRLTLALACALLSVPAWGAGGVIFFRGAIVAPSCMTQMSAGSGSASVSCPQNGAQAAEFAAVPLMPGKSVQLKSARASVETARFVRKSDPDGGQQGLVVMAEYY